MGHSTNAIFTRIEWCRRQRTFARTQPDVERWRAEEEGLWDAILDQDHMSRYRNAAPEIVQRYAMGFHDGQVMLRVARVARRLSPQARSVSPTMVSR